MAPLFFISIIWTKRKCLFPSINQIKFKCPTTISYQKIPMITPVFDFALQPFKLMSATQNKKNFLNPTLETGNNLTKRNLFSLEILAKGMLSHV